MEQIAANAERASVKYKQVEFMGERLGMELSLIHIFTSPDELASADTLAAFRFLTDTSPELLASAEKFVQDTLICRIGAFLIHTGLDDLIKALFVLRPFQDERPVRP